ncbi:MAG: peroxide stress protein YaaA [Cyclobacteriaceae bacterium]
MITLLSPAKSLDFLSSYSAPLTTEPVFSEESIKIAQVLKKKKAKDLMSLMDISENLAQLNVDRFQAWKIPYDSQQVKPAVFAFNGDVYDGLSAQTLDSDDLRYAQDHLRILSGLHGVLRPLDLIMPYRLEMGTKLKIGKSQNLYQFWKKKVSNTIAQSMEEADTGTLVNLASNEYFSAVEKSEIKGDIITPIFKDNKNGSYKIVSFWAKRARGEMAAFILKNRIEKPEDLRAFDGSGYMYNIALSDEKNLTFTRG